MALIYAVSKALKGDVSDGAKVMEAMKGILIESPRGALKIDPDTRDSVANMYIAKVEKSEDRMKPVVIDTFENVTDAKWNLAQLIPILTQDLYARSRPLFASSLGMGVQSNCQ